MPDFRSEVLAHLHLDGSASWSFGGTLSFGTSGSALGFFGTTATTRPSAYTRTYSTAARTHATPTASSMTDQISGNPILTLPSFTSGVVYATDFAAIKNAFSSLVAQHNALLADHANTKQVLNSVIDDMQSLGLLQ